MFEEAEKRKNFDEGKNPLITDNVVNAACNTNTIFPDLLKCLIGNQLEIAKKKYEKDK